MNQSVERKYMRYIDLKIRPPNEPISGVFFQSVWQVKQGNHSGNRHWNVSSGSRKVKPPCPPFTVRTVIKPDQSLTCDQFVLLSESVKSDRKDWVNLRHLQQAFFTSFNSSLFQINLPTHHQEIAVGFFSRPKMEELQRKSISRMITGLARKRRRNLRRRKKI